MSFFAGMATLCATLAVTYLVLAKTSSSEPVPIREAWPSEEIIGDPGRLPAKGNRRLAVR